MTEIKEKAFRVIYGLYNSDIVSEADYAAIRDGLTEIESLACRDKILEHEWAKLEDVPVDPETECIEEDFLDWPAGTSSEDIWHWYDERHSKGVAYWLYGGAKNYVAEAKRLYGLSKLCSTCESSDCQFNKDGEC